MPEFTFKDGMILGPQGELFLDVSGQDEKAKEAVALLNSRSKTSILEAAIECRVDTRIEFNGGLIEAQVCGYGDLLNYANKLK